MKHVGTRTLTHIALLSALALGLYVLEAQIPLPLPGMKLGLANVVTLAAMRLLGRRQALAVLAVRLFLGAFVTGNVAALAYSLCGGAASFAVMALTVGHFPEGQTWVVSVLGAIAHMAGQMLVAVYVTGTAYILSYGLVLTAAAIAAGALCGVCAEGLCRALRQNGSRR